MRSVCLWITTVIFFLLSCSCLAADEGEVELSFEKFCVLWIKSLNENFKTRLSCKKFEDTYIAQYTSCSKQFNTLIKKNKSAPRSYIGILKYKELLFTSNAPTFERAMLGPFVSAGEYPVTELFLYKNGRWQY